MTPDEATKEAGELLGTLINATGDIGFVPVGGRIFTLINATGVYDGVLSLLEAQGVTGFEAEVIALQAYTGALGTRGAGK